jgi:hypothetical protein
MYPENETDLSWSRLKQILGTVPQPCCLIGGWSVYLTINQAFEKKTGRRYAGSRDIDLGFHFDPDWNQEEVESSAFSKAIKKIEAIGFELQGSRFVKQYHFSEKRELTEEEKRTLPSYEIFNLYIDVLVDSDDPKRFEKAGFNVLEEPLLAGVFAGKEGVKTKLEGISVLMPAPQLLMEMKVKSFPSRTQDDKKTKDLIDLCALLLFSGSKPPTLEGKERAASYNRELNTTTKEEWKIIADNLDVSVSVARRWLKLIR